MYGRPPRGTYARAGLRKQPPLRASSAFAIEPYYRSRNVFPKVGRDGYIGLEVRVFNTTSRRGDPRRWQSAAVVAQKVSVPLAGAGSLVKIAVGAQLWHHKAGDPLAGSVAG
jgi:hypothetical protein